MREGWGRLRCTLEKGILDDEVAEAASVLKIFAAEYFAARLKGCRDDERVVPGKVVAASEIEGTQEQTRRRMNHQQRLQGGVPIPLNLIERHRSFERFPGYRNEFLSNLKADHARARRERISDEILGSLGLLGSLQVKGVDKNVGVEKVSSVAHSFLHG